MGSGRDRHRRGGADVGGRGWVRGRGRGRVAGDGRVVHGRHRPSAAWRRSSSLKANTRMSTTATTITAEMMITAVRCHPIQVESRSSSSGRRAAGRPRRAARTRGGPRRRTNSDWAVVGRHAASKSTQRLRETAPRAALPGSRAVARAAAPRGARGVVCAMARGPPHRGCCDHVALVRWGAGLVALLAPVPDRADRGALVAPAFVVLALVATIADDTPSSRRSPSSGARSRRGARRRSQRSPSRRRTASRTATSAAIRCAHPPALYLAPVPVAAASPPPAPSPAPCSSPTGTSAAAWSRSPWASARVPLGAVAPLLGALVGSSRPRRRVVVDPMTLADPVLVVRR